jgi:hypothetical protein
MDNFTLVQKQALESLAEARAQVAYDPMIVVGTPETDATGWVQCVTDGGLMSTLKDYHFYFIKKFYQHFTVTSHRRTPTTKDLPSQRGKSFHQVWVSKYILSVFCNYLGTSSIFTYLKRVMPDGLRQSIALTSNIDIILRIFEVDYLSPQGASHSAA